MKRAMNNVNFNLKDSKSTKKTHIVIIFRYNGHRLKYYTNLKVYPDDWNAKKQRANPGGLKSLIELNKRLRVIEDAVEGIYLEHLNAGTHLPPATFKAELDKILNPERDIEDTLFNYFDRFIEGTRNTNTKKARISVKNLLIKYAQSLPAKRLDYEDIDMDFYDKFKVWISKEGYAKSYFGKTIQILKQVLSEAHARKLYKSENPIYNNKKFKASTDKQKKAWLTMDDLDLIHSLELSENKRLERVADLFIIECLTGLRYSDLIQLHKDDFKQREGTKKGKKGWFLIKEDTQKTGEPIAVPVHPNVLRILEKYNWQLPEPITSQKFNRYVKEICMLAGINEPFKATKRIGNKKDGYNRIIKSVPKYELISSHTARRSFISNGRKLGLSPDHIMAMVGHRSASMFLLYDQQDAEEKAIQAADSEFFSTRLKNVK